MERRETSHVILESAVVTATRLKARAIVVAADLRAIEPALDVIATVPQELEIVLALSAEEIERGLPAGTRASLLKVPELSHSRLGRIKLALLLGLSKGTFKVGEVLVCLTGAFGRGALDALVVVEVGRETEVLGITADLNLPSVVNPEVFARTLDLATKIAVEGREGKPLGTIFVIGEPAAVVPYTKQLIMNPFRGYPDSERNILAAELEETIKEFAALDGAFVVSGNGVLQAAGAYLRTGVADAELEQGLGARHAAAIGITAATQAVAIVVSSSTGAVRVYMGGKLLAAIERPQQRRAPG